MANNSFRVKNSLNIEPIAGAAPTAEGDIAYNLSTNKASIHNGTSASPLVTEAHTATLTNKTLSGNTATNLTSGSGTLTLNTSGTATVPNATDTLVGKATTDTLTNKTLTGNIAVNLVSGAATVTLPTTTSSLATIALAETLTNKTLTTPTIGDFTNATHTHAGASTGGQLSLTAAVTGVLPVANGGTNKSTWTSTAIAFASGTNVLGEDSGNLSYNSSTTRMFVGAQGIASGQFNVNSVTTANSISQAAYLAHTAAPALLAASQSGYQTVLVQGSDSTAANGPILTFNRANGNTGTKTAGASGNTLGSILFNSYTASSVFGTVGSVGISGYATETPTSTAQGGELRFSTTPNTTITPKERMRIKQDGSVEFVGATSGYVAIIPPAAPTSYTLTLPSAQGAASTVLTNDGAGALTWSAGSGGTGINYITATDGTAIGAWTTFDDVSAIVDGTGGSPTVTYAVSTDSSLRGTSNFLFTHGASDQQYEGFSYAFSIDASDKGKVLQCSMDYLIASGTFADDGLHFYIYDVTNAALIQPAPYKLKNSGIVEKFAFEFQTSSSSTSYRLLAAVSTSTATAYTIRFDNFILGPQAKLYGSPVTDWVSYTPANSEWTANTTHAGKWRRVGDSMELNVRLTLTGAPTSATLNSIYLPTGYTIDTAKLPGTTGINETSLGTGDMLVAGANQYAMGVTFRTTTSIRPFAVLASGTYSTITAITQAVPATFASGDYIQILAKVPIVGWSSSQIMSSDANTSPISFRVDKTSGNHSSSGSYQDITWNAAVTKDSVGGFNGTTSYTVKVPGEYRISAAVTFAANATGTRSAKIIVNSTTVAALDVGVSATYSSTVPLVAIYPLVAGDVIKVQGFQDSGGNLNYGSAAGYTHFEIEKISGPSQIMAADSVSALYTGAPPTGTLTNAYNTTTFGTKVKDTHSAYSPGSYTVPSSGVYSITAGVRHDATYALNKLSIVAIFVDGVQKQTKIEIAGGAVLYLFPQVSVHSLPLLAGQVVTIRSYNDATTPTFGSQPGENFFSIVKTGNY